MRKSYTHPLWVSNSTTKNPADSRRWHFFCTRRGAVSYLAIVQDAQPPPFLFPASPHPVEEETLITIDDTEVCKLKK